MESTAYDEITLDQIEWDDLSIDLEPDDDGIEGISFEDDTDDEIDLEPDEDVSHISLEDAGERMRRETEEYLSATTGEFRVLEDE